MHRVHFLGSADIDTVHVDLSKFFRLAPIAKQRRVLLKSLPELNHHDQVNACMCDRERIKVSNHLLCRTLVISLLSKDDHLVSL